MDFDDKLEGLIESRKDAQRAQQDAVTARAEGEAEIEAMLEEHQAASALGVSVEALRAATR